MEISRAIAVTPDQHETLLRFIRKYVPDVLVWAYGSRVTGKARRNSDLDLVLFAPKEKRVAVGNLREALEESNLPFQVDLFCWWELPESFKAPIEAEHAVVWDPGNHEDA